MPRTSAVAAGFPAPQRKRLRPPADFVPNSPEHAFFLQTVNSVPSNHFEACDMGTLVAYVSAYIDMLASRGELRASSNIIDGRVNPLVNLVRDTTRTVNMLARSLRLNPISRVPLPARMPEVEPMSYYQKMTLAREAEADDQAN